MIVLIGRHGAYYHRQTCDHAKDGMTRIRRANADAGAYDPCEVCFSGVETPHCPGCRRADITSRNGGMSRTTDGPVWRCDTCGYEFEEPRWIHSNRGVRSDTQAGKLDAMDPDTEIYNPETETEQ